MTRAGCEYRAAHATSAEARRYWWARADECRARAAGGMRYAEACAEYERRAHWCRGSQGLELRPDGRGGWMVSGTYRRVESHGGVMCPAVRAPSELAWPGVPR